MKNFQTTTTRTPGTNNDIHVRLVKEIETGAPALVKKNPDESYTILLNNQYSFERLQQEYLHELRHIEENHFDLMSADQAEKQVRGIEQKIQLKPFFYFMYEALAIGKYLKESFRLRKELEEQQRIAAARAKVEVDAWLRDLQRKEQKPRRRRTERTPDWVKEVRRKVGLTK